MDRFTFLLGSFAATVFLASATVHVLALVPGAVLPVDHLFWLSVPVMTALIAAAVHCSTVDKRAGGSKEQADSIARYTRHVPPAAWAIGVGLFVYALLNFGYHLATAEGNAAVMDGAYVMHWKGRVLRTITEAEYHKQQRFELRGASGHWTMFAWIATVYFLFVAPGVREQLRDAPVPSTGGSP